MIEKLFPIGIFVIMILVCGIVICQMAMNIQSSISMEPGPGPTQNFERDPNLPIVGGCLVIGTPIVLFVVSYLKSTKKNNPKVKSSEVK